MRKKFLIFLSICIIACLCLCLAACVDNTDYSGEVRVTINLDKEYSEVSVNCPQGEIEKKDNKQYVVALSNTLPVDILVACPGYETVIFSYTTMQLKQNSNITESVTFKNEFYRFSFKVQNNEKIEFAEDYEGINLSIQSGRYVLESEKPISQDVKFKVNEGNYQPFVIFKEVFKYSGAKGSLEKEIPLLDERETNSAVIFIPSFFNNSISNLAIADAENFDTSYENIVRVTAGEYKKVEIHNYVFFDSYDYYWGNKVLLKEEILRNNTYCNLMSSNLIFSNRDEETMVNIEYKDKITGNIISEQPQLVSQGYTLNFNNTLYERDYSIVGVNQVAYFKELFGDKITVEVIKNYQITMHITNYQEIEYESEGQVFSSGSNTNSPYFFIQEMIDNNGYVTLQIPGNLAGKKLQFVMNSYYNGEAKYAFVLNIPSNMENMGTIEIMVESADAGW